MARRRVDPELGVAAVRSGGDTALAVRYLLPARLDDAVTVPTEAIELGAASVRLRQRALREGELLTEATVRVGFISPDGRPRRQPAAWRAAFATVLAEKGAA